MCASAGMFNFRNGFHYEKQAVCCFFVSGIDPSLKELLTAAATTSWLYLSPCFSNKCLSLLNTSVL